MTDHWPFTKVWKKGAPCFHVTVWDDDLALCNRGHHQWRSAAEHEERGHDVPEPPRMCRDCAKPIALIAAGLPEEEGERMRLRDAIREMVDQWRQYPPTASVHTNWDDIAIFRKDMLCIAEDINPDGSPYPGLNHAAMMIVMCAEGVPTAWRTATRSVWATL